MEPFSALLALCAGNSPITAEFPAQRTVTRSFDVFFDLRLNKQWFETPSRSLWRHCNVDVRIVASHWSRTQQHSDINELQQSEHMGTSTCMQHESNEWLVTKGDLIIQVVIEHYIDVIMGAIASQINSLATVFTTVYSDANHRKHQSSASLAFERGIHRRPVNSPHNGPVTWKCFHLMTSWWKENFVLWIHDIFHIITFA